MAIMTVEEREEAIENLGLSSQFVSIASGRSHDLHPAFGWFGEVEEDELTGTADYPHPDGGPLLILGYYDECTYLTIRTSDDGWEMIEFTQGDEEYRRISRSETGFYAWVFGYYLYTARQNLDATEEEKNDWFLRHRAELESAAEIVGFQYLDQVFDWYKNLDLQSLDIEVDIFADLTDEIERLDEAKTDDDAE